VVEVWILRGTFTRDAILGWGNSFWFWHDVWYRRSPIE